MSQFFVSVSASNLPPSVAESFVTDRGTATPVAHVLNINTGNSTQQAGATVFFSGSGNTVQLSVSDNQNNTMIGNGSGFTNNGASNTSLGAASLNSINFGVSNTAVGAGTLSRMTDGFANTALGESAGDGITSGSYNTLIGFSAGNDYTAGDSNNIILGPALGLSGESDTTRIGSDGILTDSTTQVYVYGIYGKTVSAASSRIIVGDSTGLLGSISNGTTGQVLTATTGGLPSWQAAAGGGFTWTVVTGATQAAAANNGYIANNAAQTVITLPAVSAVGDKISVTGINNDTGWQIAQNAGNQIFYGTSTTSAGIPGSLTSSKIRDAVTLVCTSANANWQVISSIGNITVA